MLKQTVLWTALPTRLTGPLKPGGKARLSVYISPRLWTTPQSKDKLYLSRFSDWLDWPEKIRGAQFGISLNGGQPIAASRVLLPGESPGKPPADPLDSGLWKALFKGTTHVWPYEFDNFSMAELITVPVAGVEESIIGLYRRIATNEGYGAGADLPSSGKLKKDDDIQAIGGEPITPHQPDINTESSQKPPVIIPSIKLPWWRSCCLFSFFLLVARFVKRLLGLPAGILFFAWRSPGGSGGGGQTNPPVGAKRKLFVDIENAVTYTGAAGPLPTQEQIQEEYDFHQMISALGDYPALLRALGLVVDLEFSLPSPLPPGEGVIQVIATWNPAIATFNHSLKTHYQLEAGRFLPRPRDPDAQRNGLLRLDNPLAYKILQIDPVGSALKVKDYAERVVSVGVTVPAPDNASPDSLPALRNGGIGVARPNYGAELLQAFAQSLALNNYLANQDGSASTSAAPAGGVDKPPEPTNELWAEDVVRGYRVDVKDSLTNAWHSLCQRSGRYTFLDTQGGPRLVTFVDEGFAQPGASSNQTSLVEQMEMRVSEALFTWDGWSLVAPRPGKSLSGDANSTPQSYTNEPATQFRMSTRFTPVAGSLPRLRYGVEYHLRVRTADLAGNSPFDPGDPLFTQDLPETSPGVVYGRFEPVGTPPVVLTQDVIEGESLERVVVRSLSDLYTSTPVVRAANERTIAPPKGSAIQVEQCGMFDTAAGKLAKAAYPTAVREGGTLAQKVTPSGLMDLPNVHIERVGGPDSEIKKFWVNGPLTITYLPDPYARGALLWNLPGGSAPGTPQDLVDRIPFDGTWPDLAPFKLRLTSIPAGSTPQAPAWNASERVLTVELPPAASQVVRLSAYFSAEELDKMGVWRWVSSLGELPPNFIKLRKWALQGRNWLLLPYRELTLVHAVNRPVQIPKLLSPFQASRMSIEIGETRAKVAGKIQVHAPSTAKIDLLAEWSDPLDDPSISGNQPDSDRVERTAFLAELMVKDETQSDVPLQAKVGDEVRDYVVHDIGDTKYHKITYRAVASTRFREYFPPAVTDKAANLQRPSPAELTADAAKPAGEARPTDQARKELSILNTARPAVPQVRYVIPAFDWEETTNGDNQARTRKGGGLRVYLERPWFSSGDGELLGVVFQAGKFMNNISAAADPYVTRWGQDPAFISAGVDLAPGQSNFPDIPNAHYKTDLVLDELPGEQVAAAGFPVQYDQDRKLWYADLQINPGQGAYFPFVRLALARFQPNSVAGAHLSPVVRSDFAQLTPERAATLTRVAGVTPPRYKLTVIGPAYSQSATKAAPEPGAAPVNVLSKMMVSLEYQQVNAAGQPLLGDLDWEPVRMVHEVPFQRTADGNLTRWDVTVDLPLPDNPVRQRLVIREWEGYRSDSLPQDPPDWDEVTLQPRVVYTDVFYV